MSDQLDPDRKRNTSREEILDDLGYMRQWANTTWMRATARLVGGLVEHVLLRSS